MEIPMIIVSLILVGSVFVPFYLFNAAGQNECKRLKTKMQQIITKNSLTINESEIWGITHIGIDSVQKKLLFLKIYPTENSIQLLDLCTVKEFQIVEKRKVVKTGNRKERVLELLDLQVFLKTGDVLMLNFYDLVEDQGEDFELRRIEKWKAILNGHLLYSPLKKKAA